MNLFSLLCQEGTPNAHDWVAKDLEERKMVGIETYGRFLNQDSPEDMLQMAYEEVLDLACYLRTEIEKRKDQAPVLVSPTSESLPRNQATENCPTISVWKPFLLYTLIPDFLKLKGMDTQFTMNELKEYMYSNPNLYPYQDCNKRMSSAITELHQDGYFYHPSRYKWAATAKFAEIFHQS